MSGDVQPRKRKDKKRKKDDLGVEEPRGTAAALGEGDVFMHSHHDHGTGGHWCAKVIFFSLLFVLIGLIGLIILENRGLSELEAKGVQSQYSGVLEGWLEDAPEDDHHDEHTLELNHHDDDHDEEGHSEEAADELDDHDDEEENDDELQEEDDDNDAQEDEDEQDEDGSQEQDLEDNDEQEEDLPYRKYYYDNDAEADDDDNDKDNQDNDEDNDDSKNDDEYDEEDNDVKNNDDEYDEEDNDVTKNDDEYDKEGNDVTKNEDGEDDEQEEQLSNEFEQDDDNEDDDEDNNQSVQQDDEDDDADGDSNEQNNKDEDEHEEEEEDTSLEVEKIEKEAPEDEEPISIELPALPEQDDDDDDKDQDSVEDGAPEADDGDDADDVDDADDDANDPDDDFLEADDDEPPVERITVPAGKPFVEVEEPSTEKPTDTLAEEEEYERRQEQLRLRREEAEASSQIWLKLSIGGALLVATHAIIRRATASSDAPRSDEAASREATPAIDRRMTLIPEEPSPVPIKKVPQVSSRPKIQEMTKSIPFITRKSPTFEESEEEIEDEEEEAPVVSKVVRTAQVVREEEKKELYSDEEEADEGDDEDMEEEPIVQRKVAPAAAKPPPKEPSPEPEEDVPDDVEIIDDEIIEEEEEAEDEEEISDVDDEELLTRLEAKYGRLPEPERPARRKDGGNSLEEGWPGEPAAAYWRQQLDDAEREFNQEAFMDAADRASAAQLKTSGRARWLVAKALDAAAERKRDNALLGRAIAAYLELLKMNERLSDKKLIEIAERTINRIQFRGTYLSAEPVYRLLMRRFPDEASHRTNLTVMFLMANRGDLAEELLKETLKRWPNDRLALAQYGFILKTQHNRLEEALDHLQRALEGDTGPATEPRFYYHLGDTLLLLGRFDEAHQVHKRGAAHGHFLSPAQRSLYNVPKLEARPWWSIEDTPYAKLARDLENNWKAILREGEAAKALYEQEKEGLKERGEWSQLDLFVRGREIDGRCARAPVTCAVVRREAAAAGCRRGQIKFSSMRAGTHVRPHVGPTNCRLRMHLGLSNTKDTFIRVHQEIRQWETGKVVMFDDSFEHEVWHNGTGSRLVLIVDVWHPGLSAAQRRQLPAI